MQKTSDFRVTKRGEKPTVPGEWKVIHAWANYVDGAMWLWQRTPKGRR